MYMIHYRGYIQFILLLTIGILLNFLSGCSLSPSNPMQSLLGEIGYEPPGTLVQTEEVVISLMLIAAIIGIFTQRFRIPYTVGLVLVGFGLALLGEITLFSITPELILALLVPPLVFEAAFHMNLSDLKENLRTILILAIPGVIISTLLVGGIVSFAGGIALPTALVFGALISATDPIAVLALFRSMGIPKRLQVILEGESLFNDGTAIVIFNLMIGYALTNHFEIGSGVLQFIVTAGGGILIGGILGVLFSRWIGRIDNYLVETTLTTVLAYGSYLIAEDFLGVSGVLAVVAAGLASGHIGPRGMSPTTRIVVFNFWEYAAFLANSFVFLFIGFQIDIQMLIEHRLAIAWGIVAVLLARAVTIYGLSWIGVGNLKKWKNILYWSGLRGAISLALALSLTNDIPNRTQIQAMAFGVVLFTLVVEGLTMKPLLKKSGLIGADLNQMEYQRRNARAVALKLAQGRLRSLNKEGLISDMTWNIVRKEMEEQSHRLTESLTEMMREEPALHDEEIADAWREALRTQRSALTNLYTNKIISEEVYSELVSEVDFQMEDPHRSWEGKPL